jgi:hypothetical protein
MVSDSEFIQADEKKKLVVVKINPKVFPIDLVYSASYSIMSRAYVILDGSPDGTIYAMLKPRSFKGSLEELGQEFYDELVSAAFHTVQFVRNKEIRDAMISSLSPLQTDEEDIAKIWEEKFGEGSERNTKKE